MSSEKTPRSARSRAIAIGMALLLLGTAYHFIFAPNGLLAYERKRTEYNQLQRQIERLQQQNGAIEHQIKALKTDPQAIEKEARERLRYARPGEVVFTLPESRPPANAGTQKSTK